jgi:hypothetical protein
MTIHELKFDTNNWNPKPEELNWIQKSSVIFYKQAEKIFELEKTVEDLKNENALLLAKNQEQQKLIGSQKSKISEHEINLEVMRNYNKSRKPIKYQLNKQEIKEILDKVYKIQKLEEK